MATIVAVDDDPLWCELHRQRLADAGHEVETYGDGRAALARASKSPPDLVVLDVGMYPSGRDMLRQIRRRWPGVPVAICSAYEGYRDDPEISRAEAFLAKSADASALVATVGRLLARKGGPGRC